MTTPTRAEMCADLARAMGWTGIRKIASHLCGNPPRESDIAPTCYMEGFGQLWDIPDPFTYAEHSRALVAWLAADAKLSERFNTILTKNIARYGFPLTPLEVLTAPPETIAEAAWRAIQEQPKWKLSAF